MCAGDLEVLFAALGRGAVERTLLEATLADPLGNVSTTTVGAHQHPQARLAGSGGGTEPASRGSRLVLVSGSASKRNYPEAVDHITRPGLLRSGGERSRLGYPARSGSQLLLNPLGILEFVDQDLRVSASRPGIPPDRTRGPCGWSLEILVGVARLPELSATELAAGRRVLEDARQRLYRIGES